jgi:carbon monoxide dehydrogenase subunit G
MNLSGEHSFHALQEVVWDCLLAPDDLRQAIPGCEQFNEVAPNAYDLTVKIGIASIKGTYGGHVEVADEQPMDSYRLIVRGTGKPGSVRGDAVMRLTPIPEGTCLSYVADVHAEGGIARLGSRLLGATAKLMIGQFMRAMERQVERRTAAEVR